MVLTAVAQGLRLSNLYYCECHVAYDAALPRGSRQIVLMIIMMNHQQVGFGLAKNPAEHSLGKIVSHGAWECYYCWTSILPHAAHVFGRGWQISKQGQKEEEASSMTTSPSSKWACNDQGCFFISNFAC